MECGVGIPSCLGRSACIPLVEVEAERPAKSAPGGHSWLNCRGLQLRTDPAGNYPGSIPS